MTLLGVASWLIVGIGVALVLTGVNATLYFRQQNRDFGGSWILHALYRTSATITAVAAWLTTARIVTLLLGPQWWTGVISGLAIIWLLLLPLLLRREFRSHEGR